MNVFLSYPPVLCKTILHITESERRPDDKLKIQKKLQEQEEEGDRLEFRKVEILYSCQAIGL